MEWKSFLIAFGVIFFAELGDKTQLTTMMLAAESRSPLAVFVGATIALVITSFLGVIFGEAVTKLVPAQYIRMAAGVAFIMLGGLLILKQG